MRMYSHTRAQTCPATVSRITHNRITSEIKVRSSEKRGVSGVQPPVPPVHVARY